MRASVLVVGVMIVLGLAAGPSSVLALWETNGVPVCTVSGSQWMSVIVSDGAGGAIIAWEDCRGGSSPADIYAQRVDASGTPRWAANGIPVCAATGSQVRPRIVSDGAGGAIIAWADARAGAGQVGIYAQRVSAAGVVAWPTNGIRIGSYTTGTALEMVSDAAGGAIITWATPSSAAGIAAQRVTGAGVPLWPFFQRRHTHFQSGIRSGHRGGRRRWCDHRLEGLEGRRPGVPG